MDTQSGKVQEVYRESGNTKNNQRDEEYNNWNENTWERLNSKINEADEWINRTRRKKDNLRDFWDSVKYTTTNMTGVPGGGEKGLKHIWGDISRKLP